MILLQNQTIDLSLFRTLFINRKAEGRNWTSVTWFQIRCDAITTCRQSFGCGSVSLRPRDEGAHYPHRDLNPGILAENQNHYQLDHMGEDSAVGWLIFRVRESRVTIPHAEIWIPIFWFKAQSYMPCTLYDLGEEDASVPAALVVGRNHSREGMDRV